MKFPDDAPVGPEKKAALKERLARLAVDLLRIDEQAVRGSGPGGQKKNKTSSGVLLRYRLTAAPTPQPAAGDEAGDPAREGELLVVRCARERQHSLNRFLALRELCDEVELRTSPETSERLREIERIRKQKARASSRARRRTAAPSGPTSEPEPEPD